MSVSHSKLQVLDLMDFYQVFREIIGWMTRTVKSVMTAKAYSQLGDANITVAFVVSPFVYAQDVLITPSRSNILLQVCL